MKKKEKKQIKNEGREMKNGRKEGYKSTCDGNTVSGLHLVD